jgi:transcriptional regulator with XRE-family HTH domain
MLDFEQLRQEIGTNIRLQRKNARCTQQELAEKIEKSRFWLTAIETGNNFPTIESLYLLANVLNCSISDFLPPKIHEKTVSVTGPAELVNCQGTTAKVFSILDGFQNVEIR